MGGRSRALLASTAAADLPPRGARPHPDCVEPTPATAPRPPAPPALDAPRVQALARLVGIVDRLRAPDGCPWDRKQTLASMAPCLVEEAHEAREAIEIGRDAETAEEAGDV